MSRFIAIPVNVGDCFFLERSGRTILVDGGNNRSLFPALLLEHTGVKHVDIVICTHNDSDHSEGIIGLFEAGFTCREVWLPGRWRDTFPDIMLPKHMLIERIIEGAVDYFGEIEKIEKPPTTLEEIGNRLLEKDPHPLESNQERIEGTQALDDIFEQIEHDGFIYEEKTDYKNWWIIAVPPPYKKIPGLTDVLNCVVSEAIEAAKKIRAIAMLAHEAGIPVRWFEHAPHSPKGGILGFLEPVSAQQIVKTFPYMPLFLRLALTVTNRESLVFYSPPDHQSPGVLFCSDSDLDRMSPTIGSRDIVTVPHHGSDNNRNAYSVISCAIGSDAETLTWVRSDRLGSPGGSYFKGVSGRRLCTSCGGDTDSKRVGLVGRGNSWARFPSAKLCTC